MNYVFEFRLSNRLQQIFHMTQAPVACHLFYNVVIIVETSAMLPSSMQYRSRTGRLERVMAAPSENNPALRKPGRRSFLSALAALGLTATASHAKPNPNKKFQSNVETAYRLLTPECEVQMSVEYFSKTSAESFRFRDSLTNRSFCLSTNGDEDRTCLQHFSGSMAIARYHLRARLPSHTTVALRERVLTIDHDARMPPRGPFERVLAAERDMVSDIQAFGYDPNDPARPRAETSKIPVWCLLRQDLYLNDQPAAFLIVHWKHTLDSISLVDVIPGDRTEIIAT